MSCRFLVFCILVSFHMSAFALQEFTVTREELSMMPPYCTVFYGKYVGLPQPQDSPLRNTVPDGCPALHHYCDGLKAIIRADQNSPESGYWLGLAVGAFQSVAQRGDWASCPLRPEAFTNLGKAQLRQKGLTHSAEAAGNFVKALELNPDYLPAYYALSDFYMNSGDKKKALGVVEDGLRNLPDSKGLLRRFKELGGTTPPAPIVVTAKPDASQAEKVAPIEQPQQTPEQNGTVPTTEGAASATQDTAPEQATEQKIGSPTNPWCRFCPPQDLVSPKQQ